MQFRSSWTFLFVPLAAAQDYSPDPYYPPASEDPYYTPNPYDTTSSIADPYYTPTLTTTPTTDNGFYSYPTAITTSLITTSTTLTAYVTSTTGSADDGKLNIVSAIEGLADCSQDITFSSLADSTCNPADFTCICNELQRLAVASNVASNCSPTEATQFNVFQRDVCRNVQPVSPPVTSSGAPVSAPALPTPTPALSSAAGAASYGVNNIPTLGPFYNTSKPSVPTSIAPANSTQPPTSDYTGAAVAVYGSVRTGVLAVALGLMGAVFAAL